MRLGTICRLATAAAVTGWWASAATAYGQTPLKTICRVKGQEENRLRGLGFVVGLEGTGDDGSFLPTVRSLAQAMERMGGPLGTDGLAELKDVKNAALVTVSATIPAGGARQGEQLDCVVNSIGTAKSLEGGWLFLTPLMGPDKNDPRIYAFAEGPIALDDPSLARSGRIHGGCRLEAEFFNPFIEGGKMTLVLDKNHADFQVAAEVEEQINHSQLSFQSGGLPLAKALDQTNVTVTVPPQYRENPVLFVSQVLELPLLRPQPVPRVVINQRAGVIVISGDVEIGAVAVRHKNIVIEAGETSAAGPFVPVDPDQTNTAKLAALVEALNALRVPSEDVIDIIKGLARNGKLYAQLIVE
jgi:flagellar P-ring protein precursor FlgI